VAKELPTLTIAQYAGIHAALADGFTLDEVLEQEGIPDWRWPGLDLELADTITNDPDAFSAYGTYLTQAEDWLRRTIDPLDSDVAAWTGFVAAYKDRGERLLLDHRLMPADVGRLQRAWRRRFDQDASLRRHAAELTKKPPPAPAQLQVGALVLRRFPWSAGAEQAKQMRAIEPPASLVNTPRKPRRAAAPAPAAARPPERALRSPPTQAAAVPPPPMPMHAPQAPAHSPWSVRPVAAPGPLSTPAPFSAAPPSSQPLSSQPLSSQPLSSQPLSSPPYSSQPPSSSPRSRATAEPERDELGATAPVGGMSPLAALPFAGANAPPPKVADALEPVASFGVTSSLIVEAPRLAPEDPLGSTILQSAPSSAPLPFGGQHPAPPPATLDPLPELGSTIAGGDAAMTPLPFAASTPAWTPEDYGRFCAELDSGSDRAQVFARWHIRSEAHHEKIAREWVKRLLADPAQRDRFAAALASARTPRSG
jgi:hypothetical protein